MFDTFDVGFDIGTFASNFHGGARSYLFMVKPEFPDSIINTQDKNQRFYVKSTSLPESSIEESNATWRGMTLKMGGVRTYSDWTVTYLSDRVYKIHDLYEKWCDLIAKDGAYGNLKSFYKNQLLFLFDYDFKFGISDGNEVYSYPLITKYITLYYAWPKSVGQITMDYSSQEVVQFDITFAYSYYKITKGGEETYEQLRII